MTKPVTSLLPSPRTSPTFRSFPTKSRTDRSPMRAGRSGSDGSVALSFLTPTSRGGVVDRCPQLACRRAVLELMQQSRSSIEQATNTFPAYRQESQGYTKRFGSDYADEFSARMLPNAVFPAVFHQDPRYIYRGSGSIRV